MKFVKEVNVEELFSELDAEDDGSIYLSNVVMTLKALNQDIDANLQVMMGCVQQVLTRLMPDREKQKLGFYSPF